MSAPPSFAGPGWRARELTRADLPALQALFERTPGYFEAVNGEPPRPDEALEEFDSRPPETMPYTHIWLVGFDDDAGRLIGMASAIEDLLAPRVWHIGLFLLDAALHGRGIAAGQYRGLEGWMRGQGAEWVRLGAVLGNAPAERFWERMGFVDVRRRDGVVLGRLTHTLRVFGKPLGGWTVPDYLALVARDRPGAP